MVYEYNIIVIKTYTIMRLPLCTEYVLTTPHFTRMLEDNQAMACSLSIFIWCPNLPGGPLSCRVELDEDAMLQLCHSDTDTGICSGLMMCISTGIQWSNSPVVLSNPHGGRASDRGGKGVRGCSTLWCSWVRIGCVVSHVLIVYSLRHCS